MGVIGLNNACLFKCTIKTAQICSHVVSAVVGVVIDLNHLKSLQWWEFCASAAYAAFVNLFGGYCLSSS